MRLFSVLLFLFYSGVLFAQSEVLAKEYLDKGQFEKAVVIYEELYKKNKNNHVYITNLVSCYQELKQFDKAETIIQERISRAKQPSFYVDLGYNYQLQNNTQKAEEYYLKATETLEGNINLASTVAYAFEQKNLLQKALDVYNLASAKNDQSNFEYQKARIYGQLGNMEMMIESFLNYSLKNPNYTITIQNQFQRFMDEDSTGDFSQLLRKSLLTKAQKTQDIYWNEFLSWFFILQKQYDRAFIQEKAIYKRNPESLQSVINLAELSVAEENYDLAKEIFDYILQNSQEIDTHILVSSLLMEIKIKQSQPKDYPLIKSEFERLLTEFGKDAFTLDLQILQAHFIGFHLEQPQQAQQILNDLLKLNLNNFQTAHVKMKLADMLLYEEKFNQALIYYSQIETDLKNHETGHQASLKIAKTSYYKGDFDWALKQLTVLKSSFSQLIANDALNLYLLINDTKSSDSTQAGLKKLAKTDFLIYQNKNAQALLQLEQILKEHKGEEIEAVTLIRLAQLLEEEQKFAQSLEHYNTIIKHFSDGIYLDEALFFSAEIYNKHLSDPEKAKEFYEKIIFNHQDSIYFVEARNQYRIIRGDSI